MPTEVIESRVENALLSAFLNLEGYLRGIIQDLNKEDGKIKVADAFNITRLDNTLRMLRAQMDMLGYREVILQQLTGLEQLHFEILEKAKAMDLPAEFSRESQRAVTILMQGSEAELTAIAGQASEEIGQLLRGAVLGGGDVGDLLIQIAAKLQTTRARAMTLISTSLHSFHRMLTVQHAQEAEVEWFAYLGPDDKVTRDFCKHWVGMRCTAESLEKTKGQWGRDPGMSPVTTWLGTWNCRHELVPLVGDAVKKYPVGPR